MSPIESAIANGASIQSLVLACCEAIRLVPRWDQRMPAKEAVALAEAWANGETVGADDISAWSPRLSVGRSHVEGAAYWLLVAVRDAAVWRNERNASEHLEDCIEYVCDVVDRGTVEALLSAMLARRDTERCPPSAECIEHAAVECGRAA